MMIESQRIVSMIDRRNTNLIRCIVYCNGKQYNVDTMTATKFAPKAPTPPPTKSGTEIRAWDFRIGVHRNSAGLKLGSLMGHINPTEAVVCGVVAWALLAEVVGNGRCFYFSKRKMY